LESSTSNTAAGWGDTCSIFDPPLRYLQNEKTWRREFRHQVCRQLQRIFLTNVTSRKF
jgi:hypothetical protein